MNVVDLALAILLLLCAVRGFWRGLVRESFGFAAFVIGIVAALRLADRVGTSLAGWDMATILPDAVRAGAAFVAIFLAVSASINLLGFVFDRLLGHGFLRQASKVGGSIFGVVKGAAVLAFILLFFTVFPFIRPLDREIESSRLARPMISAADHLLRGNWSRPSAAEEPA